MFSKKSLTEQCIYTDYLPKILPLNYEKIALNVTENYFYKNVQNNSEFSYLNKYYHLDDDVQIQWISEYIVDHYRLEYKKDMVLLNRSGIALLPGEQINYHHHIDDYNLSKSPDLSCIINLKQENNPCYIDFQYEGGRDRHHMHRVKLEKGKITLFNSELRHSFTKNVNTEPVLNLSLTFQIIK